MKIGMLKPVWRFRQEVPEHVTNVRFKIEKTDNKQILENLTVQTSLQII
jgi:hypothetical protein